MADHLLEPSALEATAPFLTAAQIPVHRAEDPSGETVGVGLAAVFAASAFGA